jgi:hypothetical protein
MRRAALAAALWLCLSARPARASGHATNALGALAPLFVAMVVLGLIAPSEIGAIFPQPVAQNGADFALGWSWQIPIPVGHGQLADSRHHLVGGVDYVPADDSSRVRGRIGYRYDRRYWFAGLAAGIDSNSFSWSPEIGVKFFNFLPADEAVSPSLHLLVRGDVAQGLDSLRSVAVLLGWSIF